MPNKHQWESQHQKTSKPMANISRQNQLINQKRIQTKSDIDQKEEFLNKIENAQISKIINSVAIIANMRQIIKELSTKTKDLSQSQLFR